MLRWQAKSPNFVIHDHVKVDFGLNTLHSLHSFVLSSFHTTISQSVSLAVDLLFKFFLPCSSPRHVRQCRRHLSIMYFPQFLSH
jgi:hypothetical protein